MLLSPGTRLGPYEILAPLGAGGMGEVYRARDTRLGRTVAVKVLAAHLAGHADLRQRLEREAKAISSLSHPNICVLHDIGHQEGVDFLVMEFLEGETLAKRLEKGPLPLAQVLTCGMQVADALDKAHRRGLVHRDLKPGNIMLTATGAKVLDFGLAKSHPRGAGVSALSVPPTQSSPLTAEGAIVGTFQYMSPEQLEGKDADGRSDIFSLGAVLYEMAAGKKAFPGKSQYSVASAILEKDPEPIRAAQPRTPPALERVVSRCLAKDPEDRWQTARDLAVELKWMAQSGAETGFAAGETAAAPVPRQRRERLWMTATAVLGLATLVLLAGFVFLQWGAPDIEPLRAYILPPEGAAIPASGISGGPAVISPDGKLLAFVAATPEGTRLLWVRPLGSLAAQSLAGTEGAMFPFWSPDSRSLGFFALGKLKRIDLAGGPPLPLCDVGGARGGAWNSGGMILFTPSSTSGLFLVSASGGKATPLTKLDLSGAGGSHRWPHFLPDGKHFLYLNRGAVPSSTVTGTEGVYVASLDGRLNKLLVRAVSNMAYSSGYLLFARESGLTAQAFDAKRLEITGDSIAVAGQVQFDVLFSLAAFSASKKGVLTYHSGGARQNSTRLVWFDATGKELGVLGDQEVYFGLRLSPDGKKAAVDLVDVATRNWDVWIYDLSRGARTRFTFDPAIDRYPVWSPDGNRIVFASGRKGPFSLYAKPSGGAGADEPLLVTAPNLYPADWSPDGRYILYSPDDPRTGRDLWVLPLFGDRKPLPFLQTQFNENQYARFSPDGRWVAYVSDESGADQVYVAPFPGPGGKWQISASGGNFPAWRGDGKEIVFLSTDDKLVATAVNARGADFQVGTSRTLFQARPARIGLPFDVSRDAQRFLMNTAPAERSGIPVTLVVNWTAGLKK